MDRGYGRWSPRAVLKQAFYEIEYLAFFFLKFRNAPVGAI